MGKLTNWLKRNKDNSDKFKNDILDGQKPCFDMDWLRYNSLDHNLLISRDTDKVNGILNALPNTHGHCPCVPKYMRGQDTICPCEAVRNDGVCMCGLFDGRITDMMKSSFRGGSTNVVSVRRNDRGEA